VETLKQLQKHYCSAAILIAIAGALLLILIGYKPMGRGLVLGTLFSIINFLLMAYSIQVRLGKHQNRATLSALVSLWLRFGVMAVPLIVALSFDSYHIATTVMGLFMVQFVILLEGLKNFFLNKSNATGIGN
jgi:hypothetical protein